MHQFLEAAGKLQLDKGWAKDMRQKRDLLPDYSSLEGVYKKLGWKVGWNGQVVPPDPRARLKRRARKNAKVAAAVQQTADDPSRDGMPFSSVGCRDTNAKARSTSRRSGSRKQKVAAMAKTAVEAVSSLRDVAPTNLVAPDSNLNTTDVRTDVPTRKARLTPAHASASVAVEPSGRAATSVCTLRRSASAPTFATAARAVARQSSRQPQSAGSVAWQVHLARLRTV